MSSQVAGARGDLFINNAVANGWWRDGAQVDDFQIGVQLFGHNTDGRPASDKVGNHLPGDHLRKGGNAFFADAMVGGKNGHAHLLCLGLVRGLQAGQLDG